MSVDREYRIKIQTVADGSGAKDTAEDLDRLSPKTQKYIESLKKGGESAEEMDISHRNLRFGLRMLGPEFAEAGHLGVAAFANPLTAGFLAVSVAAGKLYNDWRKMREAIETAVDISGIDRVTEALGREGMLGALIEGGVAAEDFWEKIDRLATAQDTLKEKTDDATAAIKKQTEADDKTLSAKEKAELAELKLAKAKGQISEEEYERRKSDVQNRYEGQRGNSKAIEADRIIEAREKELEGQYEIVAAGPDVVGPKARAAEEAKGTLANEKSSLDEWKKKLEEIDKWIKEKGTKALSSTEGREVLAVQEKARLLALTEIENREQGTIPAAERAAKRTAEELTQAQQKVEAATKRTGELEREIARLQADRTRDEDARVEQGAAHRRERAAEAETGMWEKTMKSPEAKQLASAAQAEQALAHGQKISLSQQEAILRVTQMYGQNGQLFLEGMRTGHATQADQQRQIMSLVQEMGTLRKQIRNLSSAP